MANVARGETMSVRENVLAQFHEVARQQDRAISALHDNLALNETGLDSLCFAIIVARLEDSLGVDPFALAEELPFPSTVGEFIALYERATE